MFFYLIFLIKKTCFFCFASLIIHMATCILHMATCILHMATCIYIWPHASYIWPHASYIWPHASTYGHMHLHMATCIYIWPHASTYGYMHNFHLISELICVTSVDTLSLVRCNSHCNLLPMY